MRDVSINIGQLLIEGASGAGVRDAGRLGRMTEAALRNLVAQRGLPRSIAATEMSELITPRLNLSPNADDREMAEELARTLYDIFSRLS